MKQEEFLEHVSQLGLSLSDRQLEQFEQYYQLLVEWNEKVNLTSITEKEAVYEKHFYDSLTLVRYASFSSIESMIDVGSGAGFPGIPLKICFPDLKLTILDSLQKRIRFLDIVVETLGLEDVTLRHGRAEEAGQDQAMRESFDMATARAVARLAVLSEYCLPFVKKEGTFIAMKGADVSFELNEAKKAIKTLGGKTAKVENFVLPQEEAERNIIFINKIGKTPAKYPRKPGMPTKKPLV